MRQIRTLMYRLLGYPEVHLTAWSSPNGSLLGIVATVDGKETVAERV